MYSYLSHSINATTDLEGAAHWHDNNRGGEPISHAKVSKGFCDLTVSGHPSDLRRLAAACIEAAEKGEALEAEHAPQAAE